MRKVLIPTDFSMVSKNAILYALELYKNTETSFTIIHVYQPSFDPTQPEIVDSSLGMTEVKKDNMNALISSITKIVENFNIEIESFIVIGFTIDIIVQRSKQFDLVIMGSTGSNNIINQVFGGISSGVASKSKCPVLLIPRDLAFKDIDNILYAYDLDIIEEDILNSFIDFAKRNNSQLHFVHIKKNKEVPDISLPMIIDNGYTVYTIESSSFRKGINSYIQDNKIDLLIMATKHRRFWKKIFHKSFTTELALSTAVPLLVYHKK